VRAVFTLALCAFLPCMGVGFLLALAVPLLAALLWGTFAVPNDPSRSGQAPIRIPGPLRLGLELMILGLGALALRGSGFERSSLVFTVLVVVHYAISYDPNAWPLRS